MAKQGYATVPSEAFYDVVIVGGAMMGASTAWFLTDNPDFTGSILVVERDAGYGKSSTARTNSCIRQQFSNELNIRISQFAADFIGDFRRHMGEDDRVPDIDIQNYGYLYLADTDAFAEVLRANQALQVAAGTKTQLLTPEQIRHRYPFYNLEGILLGSINTENEGYWDGGTVFNWWRRSARARGAEFVENEVVAMDMEKTGNRVMGVRLSTGDFIQCGSIVNASGPRAALTAAMVGIDLPVEPRKRYTWVFTAEKPLDRELPLTIDPSGVHVRQDGPASYLAGSRNEPDPSVDPDDFALEPGLWENRVWPIIAERIPQFESIRVVNEWAGHYAFNILDQNAVVGPHPEIGNFLFLNGFSGHGLQQSPAMGRGTAEWLTYGEYRTLDLSPFHYDRIVNNRPMVERAVI